MSQALEFTPEKQISVDCLHPNPDNPRKEAGDITELVASIKDLGVIQPLIARPDPQRDGHFWIEAGHRRWTAARFAKIWQVPCRVVVSETEEQIELLKQTLTIAAAENLHRRDLTPLERARMYGRLRDDCGMSERQIAQNLGISQPAVNSSLTLLELDERSQAKVESGHLKVTQAIAAVRKTRKQRRKSRNQKEPGAVWEPDHFTARHPLARKASALCEARDHTLRRRLGRLAGFSGACGQCWETVIREDQTLVVTLRLPEASANHSAGV